MKKVISTFSSDILTTAQNVNIKPQILNIDEP